MRKGGLHTQCGVLGTPEPCSPAISVSARQALSCGPSFRTLTLYTQGVVNRWCPVGQSALHTHARVSALTHDYQPQ